jgi:hypothetical protein
MSLQQAPVQPPTSKRNVPCRYRTPLWTTVAWVSSPQLERDLEGEDDREEYAKDGRRERCPPALRRAPHSRGTAANDAAQCAEARPEEWKEQPLAGHRAQGVADLARGERVGRLPVAGLIFKYAFKRLGG